MLPSLAHLARSLPLPRFRLWQAVAAALLISCSFASAQRVDPRAFANPKAQSAYAQWRKLSQTDVDCVEQSLQAQRSSLWATIQRGISPSDPAGARLLAACRTNANAQNPSNAAQDRPRSASTETEQTAARAAEAQAAAAQAAEAKARTDKAAADKAAAEKAAAERAAIKAAAEKSAAEWAAAEKSAADKAAAERAAADRAAAERAAAAQAAADKAAMQRAIEKAAIEKAAAEKAAAEAAVRTAALGTNAGSKAATTASNDKNTTHPAKADRAAIAAPRTEAHSELPGWTLAKAMAEDIFARAGTDWRVSFLFGLLTGPVIFCFGGVVFLSLSRRRSAAPDISRSPLDDRRGFDRLVAAIAAEQERRAGIPASRF
jgi:chemotaxis protein histidine kinase CheA